jgi:hypothetical protein
VLLLQYRVCMRFLTHALGTALVGVLLLTGCSEPTHPILPSPRPSSTPIFASDEEALAAAEKAYAAYLVVSDEIGARGGSELSQLGTVASVGFTDELEAEFKDFATTKLHTKGETKFDTSSLQQYLDDESGYAVVVFYTCLDVTGVQVLNSENRDVTPSTRLNRQPLEIEVTSKNQGAQELLLNRSEAWSGKSFCDLRS